MRLTRRKHVKVNITVDTFLPKGKRLVLYFNKNKYNKCNCKSSYVVIQFIRSIYWYIYLGKQWLKLQSLVYGYARTFKILQQRLGQSDEPSYNNKRRSRARLVCRTSPATSRGRGLNVARACGSRKHCARSLQAVVRFSV